MVRQHYRRNVRLMALAATLMPISIIPKIGAGGTMDQSLPIPESSADAFGDIGPSLAGVGSRLSASALRQRIVDPRVLSADTVMPSYFATSGFTRVQAGYVGKTILSAQEVEDLVAYLASLK
jgi:hypothetical protein